MDKIKQFVLISVTERDITATEFSSYDAAWNAMFEELKQCPDWSKEWENTYTEEKDENGYCETDDFGINKITAHANADDGDMKCDWMIHEITFPTNIIRDAKKLINDNSDNEGMSSDDPMSANPYSCGVHDGILDVMSALGVDVQETFDTDYYN